MGQCAPTLRLVKRGGKGKGRKQRKSQSPGEVDLKLRAFVTPEVVIPSPVVEGRTQLMTKQDIEFLWAHSPQKLPSAYYDAAIPSWRLVYSLTREGRSFMQLRHALVAEGPTLVVMETSDGHVFGGYTDTWTDISTKFYGSASTCSLFKLRPGEREVYGSTYVNENYMYCNLSDEKLGHYGGIAMGGQHEFFTWCVNEDMEGGRCSGSPSSTFGNPLLCGGSGDSQPFKLKNMEVWVIGDAPEDPRNFGLRFQKTVNTTSILELYKEQFGNVTGRTCYSDNLPPPVRERKLIEELEPGDFDLEADEKLKEEKLKEQKDKELREKELELREKEKEQELRDRVKENKHKHKHSKKHSRRHLNKDRVQKASKCQQEVVPEAPMSPAVTGIVATR